MKNSLGRFSILLLVVSAPGSQAQSIPVDVVVRLRHLAQMTYMPTQIPHNEEYVAAVRSNGSVVYTMVRNRGGTFRLPLGVVLLLHTHPYGAQREPSDADQKTAKKIGAPNCVVTLKEIWCAMPNGKTVPGVLLANKPTAQTAVAGRGTETRGHD